MKLQFVVEYEKNLYKLTAEQARKSDYNEIWLVRARNKTFSLECNRPLLVAGGIDRYPWTWCLLRGDCPLWFQDSMQRALEAAIRVQMYGKKDREVENDGL